MRLPYSLVSLADLDFDIFLDGSANSFHAFDDSTPGMVNVSELSLGLLSNQDGATDFRLFTLIFDTLATGTTLLSFTGGIAPNFAFLGNDSGGEISDVSLSGGSITIIVANGEIPEPNILWLMSVGLLGIAIKRIVHRNANHG